MRTVKRFYFINLFVDNTILDNFKYVLIQSKNEGYNL